MTGLGIHIARVYRWRREKVCRILGAAPDKSANVDAASGVATAGQAAKTMASLLLYWPRTMPAYPCEVLVNFRSTPRTVSPRIWQ